MQIRQSIFVSVIGALAFSTPALAQVTCDYTIASDATGEFLEVEGKVAVERIVNIGRFVDVGDKIRLVDSRIVTKNDGTTTFTLGGQRISLDVNSQATLTRLAETGQFCVSIQNGVAQAPAPEAFGAEVTAAPSMPAIVIPLVIAGGVGVAYLLGDDGDGATSR